MIARVLSPLLLLVFIFHPCFCCAAAIRPLLADYTHTAWTELDGAPTSATKFAQGPDGWLWIGTPTGLYRFDGVRFQRTDQIYGHPLESSNLMGLATGRDGALWVGYRVGGVSVFRKNGAHTYAESDGLHPVGVMHIEVAPDGGVWLAMRDGLAVLPPHAKRFEYLGSEAGLPVLGVFQILFARDGTTWIGTNTGAFFRRPGETRFTQAWPRGIPLVWMAEAPDGTIWGNDFSHGYHRVLMSSLTSPRQAKPELEGVGMLFDRQGTMWMVHADRLQRRLASDRGDRSDQSLSPSEKLSGSILGALFQDREGNLWIGTSRGIDRLRPNRLRIMTPEKALEYPALVGGPDGDMWIGDYVGDIWRYSNDGPLPASAPAVKGKITASYTTPDGVLWLGGMAGIERFGRDGSLTVLTFPPELKTLRVHAMQQDRDGALWASISAGKGVYKIVNGAWIKSGGLQGIPDLLATSMAQDADGKLWMAHMRSQITVVDGPAVRHLGDGDGLQLGTPLTLYRDGKSMWVGGEKGVALYRDGRFVALRGQRDEAFRGVSGIVRLPGGELWLHGADGLYRIAADEVDAWLTGQHGAVAFERFDAQDGMRGHAPQLRPVPSLKRDRDGLLWYATANSVGTIDPARIARNRLTPPIEVLGVMSDGVRHAASGHALTLPQGTRNLQVDFTALSLSMPERVRLRYRLTGLDRGWQDSAGNRQASYTNLEPGKYRFEVIASNEDNLWNTDGAALEIDIPPTFVQSIWFKLLLAMLAVGVLVIAYKLRIRYLSTLMHERLQERLLERSRIARSLHDTLLQSVQALLMSFDRHSRLLTEGSQERQRLDQTLNLAEQLLVEGRDQVMDLRASAAPQALEQILGQFGKGLSEHRPHAFELKVTGKARKLRPEVHEHIYAIAREALFNASRYAEASRIELNLDYGVQAFSLQVRDNGQGMDDSVCAAGRRPGHWGLVGMRERAAEISATLDINSQHGAGTSIMVTVPAKAAY